MPLSEVMPVFTPYRSVVNTTSLPVVMISVQSSGRRDMIRKKSATGRVLPQGDIVRQMRRRTVDVDIVDFLKCEKSPFDKPSDTRPALQPVSRECPASEKANRHSD